MRPSELEPLPFSWLNRSCLRGSSWRCHREACQGAWPVGQVASTWDAAATPACLPVRGPERVALLTIPRETHSASLAVGPSVSPCFKCLADAYLAFKFSTIPLLGIRLEVCLRMFAEELPQNLIRHSSSCSVKIRIEGSCPRNIHWPLVPFVAAAQEPVHFHFRSPAATGGLLLDQWTWRSWRHIPLGIPRQRSRKEAPPARCVHIHRRKFPSSSRNPDPAKLPLH